MFYDALAVTNHGGLFMSTLDRWEPFRDSSPDTQLNRLFNDFFGRASQDQNLTTWAPAVDIYEGEHELVVKADLPDVKPEDLDIRIENNILTIRGERKFEAKTEQKNYLRVERAYGSFARSFSLANTVNTEAIKADYKDGVLTLSVPKREEAKPKQIKVNVGAANASVQAAAAGAR
jgi:HSP20 family protein